jgi:hypothetical protein
MRALRLALVLASVVACAPVASATAAVSHPDNAVGLTTAYSLNNCSRSRHTVDPINVVWTGADALPGNVGHWLDKWGGWSHNDYNSPWGVDKQYVTELDGHCYRDDTQRADDCAICNRNHVRLFSSARGRRLYVAGDAHHDSTASAFSGCDHAVIAGHYASSFNKPRAAIAKFWGRHQRISYRWWGNTRRIKQCNGSTPSSDGWVLFASTPSARAASVGGSHPTNRVQPTIKGEPVVGNTLTADPGQWSGNATGYIYSWCRPDLNADTCTPIPGATGQTWTPGPADAGKKVAVTVRPRGSDPNDAVISPTVTIAGDGPVNLTPPSISVPQPTYWLWAATLDPGTWSGNPTLSYVNGTCTTRAACEQMGVVADARPVFVPDVPNYAPGSMGDCGPGHFEATVIATNPAGEVIKPVRSAEIFIDCSWAT